MAEQPKQEAATDAGLRPILPIFKLEPKPHLVGIKCGNCGAVFLDLKRLACSKCGTSGRFEQIPLSTKGNVWVFSVIHQSFPGIKTPYVTAIVDLPEGVSVKSNLVDVDPDDLEKNPKKAFGMPVELVGNVVAKDRQGHDVVAFQFRPSAN
ncbi:MAG TPA: Zn-ribbon domain-containing OB-fold protein [Candidatus Binataceae bacterium]|nr:Zn-ribbon domain-containing OB-fold protein [Candidatus Binataceae bacterium]